MVPLAFSGTEPGRVRRDQIGVSLISCEGNAGLVLQITAVTPFYKIVIDLASKLFTAFKRDQSERTDRDSFQYALAALQ